PRDDRVAARRDGVAVGRRPLIPPDPPHGGRGEEARRRRRVDRRRRRADRGRPLGACPFAKPAQRLCANFAPKARRDRARARTRGRTQFVVAKPRWKECAESVATLRGAERRRLTPRARVLGEEEDEREDGEGDDEAGELPDAAGDGDDRDADREVHRVQRGAGPRAVTRRAAGRDAFVDALVDVLLDPVEEAGDQLALVGVAQLLPRADGRLELLRVDHRRKVWTRNTRTSAPATARIPVVPAKIPAMMKIGTKTPSSSGLNTPVVGPPCLRTWRNRSSTRRSISPSIRSRKPSIRCSSWPGPSSRRAATVASSSSRAWLSTPSIIAHSGLQDLI